MKNQNILLIFYCSGHTWEMFLAATKIWNFPSCVEAFNGPLYIIFQFTYVTWEKHSYVYIGIQRSNIGFIPQNNTNPKTPMKIR